MTPQFALIQVDEVLLHWADEIVCMEPDQAEALRAITTKPVVCLNIEDSFEYRSEKLQWLIKEKYQAAHETPLG